ncbi:MAG: hypothetical protein K6E19_07490 [Lachnospiraceae bacterium]|nr:hypothetical protein [Lachnospiraceae bacterium]
MFQRFLDFFRRMPKEKNRFGLRAVLVIIAVCCQGFGVFWLNQVDFGTDPCSVLNYGISSKVGLPFGTTLLIFNILLFMAVLAFGREQIGLGTLANAILVGYSADFTQWVFSHFLPEGFFEPFKTRVSIMIPALIWFVIAASTYMAVDLGQSPYDSIPAIVSRKLPKIPFMVIRIAWDGLMTLGGFLLGGTVGIVTVAMVFMLGPVITAIKKFLQKNLGFN